MGNNTEQTSEEAIVDIQLGHYLKAKGENLGQYRIRHQCSCGEDVYVDGHDPENSNLHVVQAKHIAKYILAWKDAAVVKAQQKARLEENAWSRQKMIVAQAYEAPNSGFGRMVKWAIDLFNARKLELLNLHKEKGQSDARRDV